MEWQQIADSVHGGGLPSSFVNALAFGRNGEIWFGTTNGFTRLKGTEWSTWNSLNSRLPDNNIRALAVDAKGNLWIGTRKGLAEFNEAGILP
jgi:ligand-binding sensor domain-containing protein